MWTLILGGARSGKSDLAVRLAAAQGDVLFVATMEPLDEEMEHRIDAHRASRPPHWQTIEVPLAVTASIKNASPHACVVIDCVTLWVSNVLLARVDTPDDIAPDVADRAAQDAVLAVHEFVDWASGFDGEVIVVSNEAGMGVVPAHPLGRLFRDALGTANGIIAARADRVYYLVAGLALELKALGARPLRELGEAPDA